MKCKKLAVLIMAGVLAVSALVGCSSGGSEKGSADDYPSKDISVIIPKAAGGGTDTAARGLMQYMKENLEGSNFVATNKPDGGGVTGMVETSAAKADGYTLGMVTVELSMFPWQDKCQVTPEDYAAICAPIAAPAALIVPADSPYDTVDDFVAYCKENPGSVEVGNSGMGAIWHVAAVSFENEFDVKLKHIPYPNGSADIAAALTGGHIDATIADPSSYKSQVDAGEMKILGIMSEERPTIYPDVLTFKEMGHDMVIRAWASLVAPKDTPEDILTKLRDAAKTTCESDEFVESFEKQGIDPQCIIGEDCQKMMEDDFAMYEDLLKDIEVE